MRVRNKFGYEAYQKCGNIVKQGLKGMIISKRKVDGDKPNGLVYESQRLGIDMWDLLETLEFMCYKGEAEELYPGDSYEVF